MCGIVGLVSSHPANQQVYDEAIVEHAIATVVAFVESGRISESRLDESVDRIEGLFATVE